MSDLLPDECKGCSKAPDHLHHLYELMKGVTNKTYEDGLRDGQLVALETKVAGIDRQIYSHEKRLRLLERLAWIVMGALIIIQALPLIQNILEVLG